MTPSPGPPSFQEGLALLLAGEAFAAHELWEELWLESGGGRARYLQGWIQLAVALHHWQAGRHAAARRIAARGREKLAAPEARHHEGEPSPAAVLAWEARVFAGLAGAVDGPAPGPSLAPPSV